jgi:hypothetical protein
MITKFANARYFHRIGIQIERYNNPNSDKDNIHRKDNIDSKDNIDDYTKKYILLLNVNWYWLTGTKRDSGITRAANVLAEIGLIWIQTEMIVYS